MDELKDELLKIRELRSDLARIRDALEYAKIAEEGRRELLRPFLELDKELERKQRDRILVDSELRLVEAKKKRYYEFFPEGYLNEEFRELEDELKPVFEEEGRQCEKKP